MNIWGRMDNCLHASSQYPIDYGAWITGTPQQQKKGNNIMDAINNAIVEPNSIGTQVEETGNGTIVCNNVEHNLLSCEAISS